jgi:hypothetical protein
MTHEDARSIISLLFMILGVLGLIAGSNLVLMLRK